MMLPAAFSSRTHYIDLGDHLFLPVGSQMFIPFLEAGGTRRHNPLRVYDAAGNYSESSQVVHVASQ